MAEGILFDLIGSYAIDGKPRKLFRALRDCWVGDDRRPVSAGDLLVFTGIGDNNVQVCTPITDIVNG